MPLSKFVPLFAAAAALAACQQQAATPAEGNTAGVGTFTAPATPGAPAAAGATTLWNNGAAKPLDLQVAHPNGTVLQLTSLQSRQTETVIGFRVINGRDRDVELNRFNSNRAGYLVLDNGERLYLSPPATNTRLTVPAGQTFEGELVFLGRLSPVQSAVLVLNENSSADNRYTTTPQFRIDLPLGDAQAGAAQ